MSEHSGVAGKTPWAAARGERAKERLAKCVLRTPQEQLELLDGRPGESRRERRRLKESLKG